MKTHFQAQFKTAEEAAELAHDLLENKFSGGATQAMLKSEMEAAGHKVADRKVCDGLLILSRSGRIGTRKGHVGIGLARIYYTKKVAKVS